MKFDITLEQEGSNYRNTHGPIEFNEATTLSKDSVTTITFGKVHQDIYGQEVYSHFDISTDRNGLEDLLDLILTILSDGS